MSECDPMCCVIGEPCSLHGFIHGAEAEELREELDKLIERSKLGKVRVDELEKLLERVDARDSVAWLEVRARHQRIQEQ